MIKKNFIIRGLVVATIIVIVLAYKRQWSIEYERLLNGNAEVSSIIFTGQRRRIEVKDSDIIRDFEEALVNGWGKGLQITGTGTGYEVKFIFKSGIRINTGLNIYEDESGFQLADYSHVDIINFIMGDPRYANAEFKPNIHQKTKEVISYLLQ